MTKQCLVKVKDKESFVYKCVYEKPTQFEIDCESIERLSEGDTYKNYYTFLSLLLAHPMNYQKLLILESLLAGRIN